MRKLGLKIMTMLWFCLSGQVYATMPVIDFGAIAQLASQAKVMKQQLESLQLELKQLGEKNYQWSNAQSLINQLGDLVQQKQGLAYNAKGLDSQFRQAYPGYSAPQNFEQQYEHNTQQTLNTLNGVLHNMGLSAKDFTDENARLAFLQRQSQNSTGQLQAIQASSQIASESISQLQLLRQVMISQTNAQTTYYATQIQNEASERAQLSQIIGVGNQKIPAYGSSGTPLKLYDFQR